MLFTNYDGHIRTKFNATGTCMHRSRSAPKSYLGLSVSYFHYPTIRLSSCPRLCVDWYVVYGSVNATHSPHLSHALPNPHPVNSSLGVWIHPCDEHVGTMHTDVAVHVPVALNLQFEPQQSLERDASSHSSATVHAMQHAEFESHSSSNDSFPSPHILAGNAPLLHERQFGDWVIHHCIHDAECLPGSLC